MTTLDVEVVPETGVDDGLSHFICCRVPHDPIVPTQTLCGMSSISAWEGESAEVDCVVCNHMAWSGCCPLQPDQRCVDYDPNADDRDDEETT